MKTVNLEKGGVRLRSPEPADVDALFALENDESLWPVSCNVNPYSRHQLEQYVKDSVHDIFAEHQVRFIIDFEGRVAGCIDLTDVDAVQSHAQVGIALLDEFRHKGIASAALDMICAHAADRLRLHQLVALVPAGNGDSLRLFVSAGFATVGTLRDWMWAGTRYEDVSVLQKIFGKNQL